MDAHPDGDGFLTAWQAQEGPQATFVTCPIFEVFYGGARGGGKTDAVLGEWAIHADEHGANAIGLIVRRTRTELLETFERARAIYTPIGASFTIMPMRVVMPGGGRLTFAYLERDSDADAYQGHSYTRVYIEEVGTFPSPAPIMKLMATLRSGVGAPCGMRLTGNPGGAGHQWVKARYIDPAPLGWRVITDDATGLQRTFIPAKVRDNRYLGEQYIAQIKASGPPQLVRAWLDGDWDVIAGAFFPEWSRERHIIAPRELPQHWMRFRSFDWGSARPFSVQWWAVSDGEMPGIAKGALVQYREWYGMAPGQPNVGLRMTAEEVADGIKLREQGDTIRYGIADPSIFKQDGGPSIGERMGRRGVYLRPGDNTRIGRNGAMGGWDQVRARLKGDGEEPALVVFSTCTEFIRTFPALQHDPDRPEDVLTESEDHCGDGARYACTSRPYVLTASPPKPKRRDDYGFDVSHSTAGGWAA
jgi:hypothetical protein